MHGRGQDLVVRQTRPGPRCAPAPAAADEPRGERQQGERLLAGPVAGRQQLVVEVQEDDERGRADPVQHRLGPDRAPAPPEARRSGPALARPTSATSRPGEGGEVLAQPGRRPGRTIRGRVGPQDGHVAGPEVAHRGQCSTAGSPGGGRSSWTSAAPQRVAAKQASAAAAGEQAGPALAVEHGHDGSARLAVCGRPDRRGEPRRVAARPGSSSRASISSTGAQPLRSASRDKVTSRPASEQVERRAGAHQQARDAGSPGALVGQHGGLPGRNPLFLVGVRVGVEHDDAAQGRLTGASTRRAGADDDRARPRPPPPTPRAEGPRRGPDRSRRLASVTASALEAARTSTSPVCRRWRRAPPRRRPRRTGGAAGAAGGRRSTAGGCCDRRAPRPVARLRSSGFGRAAVAAGGPASAPGRLAGAGGSRARAAEATPPRATAAAGRRSATPPSGRARRPRAGARGRRPRPRDRSSISGAIAAPPRRPIPGRAARGAPRARWCRRRPGRRARRGPRRQRCGRSRSRRAGPRRSGSSVRVRGPGPAWPCRRPRPGELGEPAGPG